MAEIYVNSPKLATQFYLEIAINWLSVTCMFIKHWHQKLFLPESIIKESRWVDCAFSAVYAVFVMPFVTKIE